MNSHNMQHLSNGPPPSNANYAELNANLFLKGQNDIRYPQKPPSAPSSGVNTPLAKRLYYENDVQGHITTACHSPSLTQTDQNHLAHQMSNMVLTGQQRINSLQACPPQTQNNVPTMPFSSTANGINNQNHYSAQGEVNTNDIPKEKSLLQQQELTTSQLNLQSSYGSHFSGQHQLSGQVPSTSSLSGSTICRSTPQSTLPEVTDYHNQTNQNRHGASTINQPDISGQSYAGKYPGKTLSSSNIGNQSPMRFFPPNNQHNLTAGPPLPGTYSSVSPALTKQISSGPPTTGQDLQNPPSIIQQNSSRPIIPYQSSHLLGQQHLSGSFGQQNVSGPPSGQQNLHSQYSYGNQIPEQRRFSQNPSQSNQNISSTYSHTNHQYSELNYQGYQQQNYGHSGQNNVYANQNAAYQSGMGSPPVQPQQSRRLDPDQMPNPIQVIQDDIKIKGGVFITNEKGLIPPLVTTKFTVEDQGNASPRFIRSTVYTVPTNADITKQIQIPFALILSPMAQVEEGEYEPPIVDTGETGPVRCNRCKAYMSSFMQFIDAGRRFQCMFCKATTEVPTEYFQHLDHTGQRIDRFERPELIYGTYEFLASKEYCKNQKFPKAPAIIFLIDVSYNTIKSGLVNLLCAHMKKIIRSLPIDVGHTKSNMKVGFITYSNSVQFYNIKASLAQPQMMVVGDVQDMFMPLLDGFLCDPEESEALIDSLMSQIPTMFKDNCEVKTILAPAIQAGLEALKASECAGKLMVFHSSLPTADAPGKLKNRDDRKLLGTDKEKTVLAPQTDCYNNLAQECVGSACSVDLFIFNNSYIDIATIGQISRLTGGEVYKYTYFQADNDGERLITDVINNISRPIAFDAVMRVRTSTGVRPTDFYGHFFMSNTTEIELPSIDCDKSIAVEIKHDDKLTEDDGVYLQTVLLYTSCSGIRRIRIMNLSLKTSSQMAELYRACDLDAIINFLAKKCVFNLVEHTPKAVKEALNSRCVAILASYRKHCASPSSSSQLVLPECMKLLPLYISGLLKSDAITGGNGITIDQKSYVMMSVATMPIRESTVHVYPRLLPLHDIDPQGTDLPPMLRCSIDKFSDHGAYLLENGIHMFIWLGLNLSPQWIQAVFGVTTVAQLDTDKSIIPPLDNALNLRIRNIINYIQSERRHCMQLTLTRQRDKMELVMRQFLVEDQGTDGSAGYVDFLCHMHREIRTLLS